MINPTQFRNGFLAGILLFAAANSLSYFYWSQGWGTLFGGSPGPVGIGFPLLLWHNGMVLPAPELRLFAMVTDILIGLICAGAVGATVKGLSDRRSKEVVSSGRKIAAEVVPGMASVAPARELSSQSPMQFSLRDGLIATALVAVVMSAVGRFQDPMIGVLKGVYLAGPCVLIWVAILSGRSGKQAAWVLAFAVGLMLLAAVAAEQAVTIRDFTKGLMGVFVCWTPQFVVGVALIMVFEQRS